jgi:hypothetical protein
MQSLLKLEEYKEYLDKALSYYYPDDFFIKYFHRLPKSRYYSFQYCLEEFEKNSMKTIVELGTSRSFVDGRFEGCNSDDIKYWESNNPEKWDWSAGTFTRTFNKCLSHVLNLQFYTVDLAKSHIQRCKHMNQDFPKIQYHISSSEDFLKNFKGKIDLLYLDTGDMTPIEPTAQLHLREAEIIVKRNLLSENGIILIDDIRSPLPYLNGENIDLGKGYLSIPYFLKNGFELIMDEYQTILKKSPK